MHNMLKEILEQPEVISRFLVRENEKAREIAKLASSHRVNQIVLAARGTSDHAAVYGQYLFQIVNHMAAFLATPSIVTLYNSRVPLENTLVIGISQSGHARDVMEYMAASREQGSPVVAITNTPDSPMARESEITVLLEAGTEKSVAATKTYTASLAALALISAHMSERPQAVNAIAEAPNLIREALMAAEKLRSAAQEMASVQDCFVVGRGLSYTTALETSLKIMETSFVRSRAYSSADLMHGPVAAEQTVPCIVYAPRDAANAAVIEVAERLRDFGTRLMVVSSDDEALELAHDPLRIPYATESWVDPMVQIVAGQVFAYHLAVAKGLDPDTPRGLSKVTITI